MAILKSLIGIHKCIKRTDAVNEMLDFVKLWESSKREQRKVIGLTQDKKINAVSLHCCLK